MMTLKKLNRSLPLFILLLTAVVTGGRAQNCNLISNADFSMNLEGWTAIKVSEGTVPELQINLAHELMIKTIIPGKTSGSARAACMEVYLEQGERYVLEFDAYAKQPRKVDVAFANHEDPNNIYFIKELSLDTIKQHYKIEFKMNAETDKNADIQLFLSDSPHKMYFDDFKMVNEGCVSGEQERVTENKLLLTNAVSDASVPKAVLKQGYDRVNVTGYVRFFGLYRNMEKLYEDGPVAPKTFIVNGVYPDSPIGNGFQSGYREPFVNLEFSANPSPNTDIKFDFLLDNQLTGSLGDSSKRIQVYRYVNFEGNTRTNIGNFRFKLGGVHFENLSQFTLWNYQFRDDMFERYPWEWAEYNYDKYDNWYAEKSVGRDSRFGSSSFQGAIVELTGLPKGVTAKGMFGKANGTNNGFNSFLNNNYKYIGAGRVNKQVRNHLFGLVYFNQRGYINDIAASDDPSNLEDERIFTTTGSINFQKANIQYETGISSFINPDIVDREWGGITTIHANLNYIKKTPISIHAFHIGNNYLNVNSAVMNNSQYGAQFGLDEEFNSVSFKGGLGEFGQMGSNRQGVNVSVSRSIDKLKIGLGLGMSRELTNNRNEVTFQHRLAGLNRSRFVFYRSSVGPYDRVQNIWRHSYETLSIDSTYQDHLKGFSTIDFSLKYKVKVFGKDLIIGNYVNYNSIQDDWAVIPKTDESAFVKILYEEFNLFYKITKATTLVGQASFERVQGNELTDVALNGKNADQFGKSFGLGLDIDFGRTAGIYLRSKWYSHKDNNFVLDEFKGFESTVEFKIWF